MYGWTFFTFTFILCQWLYALEVGAAQEVAVPQHTVQPLGPQVVLKHVRPTVDVGKTCTGDQHHFLVKEIHTHNKRSLYAKLSYLNAGCSI